MTILIIEDDPYVRGDLCDAIDTDHILQASTAKSAIQQAKEATPQIVLLDIHLPDCNDLSLLSKLSTIIPKALIIIISVEDDFDIVIESTKYGIFDYILKPYSQFQVKHRIGKAKEYLEQREMIKKLRETLESSGIHTQLYYPKS